MGNSLVTLGKRLEERRKELGLTLEAVAKKMGTSHGQLSRYLNGHRQPNLETLDRLADALGVSTAWLLSEEEATHPLSECVRRVSAAALGQAEAPVRRSSHKAESFDIHSPGFAGMLSKALQDPQIREVAKAAIANIEATEKKSRSQSDK